MKLNLVRAFGTMLCVGGFALALTSGSAFAYRSSEIDDDFAAKATPLSGIAVVLKKDGAEFSRAQTDATGRFVLNNLAPGHYEIDVDGTSLRAGIDKLAPPPGKKGSGSSLSIGGVSSTGDLGSWDLHVAVEGAIVGGRTSILVPYCHDGTAGRGMSIGFTVPEGSGPAAVTLGVFHDGYEKN